MCGQKLFFQKDFLEVHRHMNSAGAVAVWVGTEIKAVSGVDNKHTKMLSAVTA